MFFSRPSSKPLTISTLLYTRLLYVHQGPSTTVKMDFHTTFTNPTSIHERKHNQPEKLNECSKAQQQIVSFILPIDDDIQLKQERLSALRSQILEEEPRHQRGKRKQHTSPALRPASKRLRPVPPPSLKTLLAIANHLRASRIPFNTAKSDAHHVSVALTTSEHDRKVSSDVHFDKTSGRVKKSTPKCSPKDIRADVPTWDPTMPRKEHQFLPCLLYTSPSPRDQRGSRMPSSA